MRTIYTCFTVTFLIFNLEVGAQQNGTLSDTTGILMVPKCCPIGSAYGVSNKCEVSNKKIPLFYTFYYKSNETHIDPEFTINKTLTPYVNMTTCPNGSRLGYEETDVLGLIYNSSILVEWEKNNFKLLSPVSYCMEWGKSEFVFVVCLDKNNNVTTASKANMLNFYFPFLILSTLCYFASAFCYYFILHVTEDYKKCFIGYSTSMGLSFFCMVLLQLTDSGCNPLGSMFFLFTICSFGWLACLCVDLLIMVRFCVDERPIDRFHWYIAATVVFPLIMTVSSVIPTAQPDVPNSFIKSYYFERSMCNFEGSSLAMFFVPIGLLLVLSLCSLSCAYYFIRKFDKTYRNHYTWLEKRSRLKYIFVSCILIWITTTVWILNAIVSLVLSAQGGSLGGQLAIDTVEALQGIFAFFIFVSNRYTRKDIYNKFIKPRAEPCTPDDDNKYIKTLLEGFTDDAITPNGSTRNVANNNGDGHILGSASTNN